MSDQTEIAEVIRTTLRYRGAKTGLVFDDAAITEMARWVTKSEPQGVHQTVDAIEAVIREFETIARTGGEKWVVTHVS